MKSGKSFMRVLLTVVMLLCAMCFVACGKVEFKIGFIVEDAVYATINTKGEEVLKMPNDPEKDGYIFDGWYWDDGSWEKPFTANSLLDAPLSSNMSVYAKFVKNEIEGVSFENVETTYDGTEKEISVRNLPDGANVSYDKPNTYTDAGGYTVTATIRQANHFDLVLTATLKINKAIYDMSSVVFTNSTAIYDGQSHSVCATNLPKGVTVSYENNEKVNAGTYTVTAKFIGDNKNFEVIPDMSATLTIEKATVEKPVADTTTFIYNGKEQTYNIVGKDLCSVKGNKQTNAGNYTVEISLQDNANYQWTDKTTDNLFYGFCIQKAVYDISGVIFESKTVTYDSKIHSIYATNLPKGVTVSYENNENINTGSYTVIAKFTGDSKNFENIPDKTATLTILPDSFKGLAFESKVFTYDGSEKKIEVTNIPTGATVTYDKPNTQINAGEYTIKATVKKENYSDIVLTATLTINKATYNMSGIKFENKTVTYNGEAYSIFAQNVPVGLSVSYIGNNIANAGTYNVTAVFTDTSGNYENPQNKTATLTINKANVAGISFTDKTFVYDGDIHTATVTGKLPSGVSVSYENNDKINVGTYTVTAIFNDNSGNYIVPANMTAKLIIEKATVSGITFDDKTFTYNGEKRNIEIGGILPEDIIVSYSNNGKINAGIYTVIATFSCKTDNYFVPDDMTATLTIKKAVYDMSNVSFDNKTVTYDGKMHSITVSGTLPEGVAVTYSNNDKINANQYVVTASFRSDSINYYAIDDMQAILTINKATYDMSEIVFVGGTFTYDGTQKFIYVTGEIPNGVTVSYENNGKVNANTYTVTAIFTGDTENYNKLSDWTASLIINKATYDMSDVLFKNQTFTYDTTTKNAVITGSLPNGVEVSYVGNGKINVGTYQVMAKFNGDRNNFYLIEDMTATLKINQAVPYIREVSCDQSLNLYSKVELIADTDVAGTIMLDDGQTLALGYKTYSWKFVPEDAHNYTYASGTLGLTVCALVSYYNDDILFDSQNIIVNNSAYVPEKTPLKNDENGLSYTFSHWSIEKNGEKYDFTNSITADLSLYAVYKSEEIVYAINYYDTNGIENDNITSYTVSTEFTLLSLQREHYEFGGWTDKSGNKLTKITKGTFGTLDIYATWTPVEYVINYVLTYRGASNKDNPQTYNVEDTFLLADATFDEYHAFSGWYLEEDFINEKKSISVGESGTITVYAKWDFSGTFISTAEEFKNITYKMDGIYELKNNIVIDFTLGDTTNPFTGYLLGNDFVISGSTMIVSINSGYIGYVETDQILCLNNLGTIFMCKAYGVSIENSGNIESCISYGFSVRYLLAGSDSNYRELYRIGGIVATNSGSIINCLAIGDYIETVYNTQAKLRDMVVSVGGIAGYSSNTGIIKNCYYTGILDVVVKYRGTYVRDDMETGTTGVIGGITGGNEGNIEHCFAKGALKIKVEGRDSSVVTYAYIGGITGQSYYIYGNLVVPGEAGTVKCSFADLTELTSTSTFSYVKTLGEIDAANNFYNSDIVLPQATPLVTINYSGTATSSINYTSRTWLLQNLGLDESIWRLQDGQLPKLWFETE